MLACCLHSTVKNCAFYKDTVHLLVVQKLQLGQQHLLVQFHP